MRCLSSHAAQSRQVHPPSVLDVEVPHCPSSHSHIRPDPHPSSPGPSAEEPWSPALLLPLLLGPFLLLCYQISSRFAGGPSRCSCFGYGVIRVLQKYWCGRDQQRICVWRGVRTESSSCCSPPNKTGMLCFLEELFTARSPSLQLKYSFTLYTIPHRALRCLK